jgi:hypothetical protein
VTSSLAITHSSSNTVEPRCVEDWIKLSVPRGFCFFSFVPGCDSRWRHALPSCPYRAVITLLLGMWDSDMLSRATALSFDTVRPVCFKKQAVILIRYLPFGTWTSR